MYKYLILNKTEGSYFVCNNKKEMKNILKEFFEIESESKISRWNKTDIIITTPYEPLHEDYKIYLTKTYGQLFYSEEKTIQK